MFLRSLLICLCVTGSALADPPTGPPLTVDDISGNLGGRTLPKDAAQSAVTAQAPAPAEPKEDSRWAISATDLLHPDMLPEASMGMAVEKVDAGKKIKVVTVGAEFEIDPAGDTISASQRIPKLRKVSTITLPPGTLQDIKLDKQTSGMARLSGPGGVVRINGDSLLMIAPAKDGKINAALAFTPDYHAEYKGNFNFFDPVGGISFFEHGKHPDTTLEAADDPVRVTWNWKAGDVFWAGVSPPKPYDWEKSIAERTVIRGSSMQRYMFPTELEILWLANGSKFNVFLMFAENMWRNWQTEMIPQQEAEYLRVQQQAKAEGLKVMVYCGPKHYIGGTIMEGRATDDVDDPRSGGWTSGANARLFIYQVKRLVERYQTRGFYFDEMYCNHAALAANYWVTRMTRNLIGESGAFWFHSTEDVLGDRRGTIGVTHCPTIHSYFNVIYKGEAVRYDTVDRDFPGYMRYNLGTYNVSNAIASPCLNFEQWPDKAQLDDWLARANVRMLMPQHYLYTANSVMWWKDYLPRLRPELKAELEPTLMKPTGIFAEFRKKIRAGK